MSSKVDERRITIMVSTIIILVSVAYGIHSYVTRSASPIHYEVVQIDHKICSMPMVFVMNSTDKIEKVTANPVNYGLDIASKNERILVCLGDYSDIVEVRSWMEGPIKVIIFGLKRGGSNTGIIINPEEDLEVYATLINESGEYLLPLIKVIDKRRIIDLRGKVNIEDVSYVKIYAFPVSIEFNETNIPSDDYLLKTVKIYNGTVWCRLDSKRIPIKAKISQIENQWLLVYAKPCKGGYVWFKIGESIGKSISFILSCEENG